MMRGQQGWQEPEGAGKTVEEKRAGGQSREMADGGEADMTKPRSGRPPGGDDCQEPPLVSCSIRWGPTVLGTLGSDGRANFRKFVSGRIIDEIRGSFVWE